MIIFFKKIVLLLCILFISTSNAQQLNFKHFGIEDGLPQSGINAITHDNFGNIWIGTSSGLCSYNGIKFTNYSKKNGLAENRVTSLFKTQNNLLLIGHAGGSLSIYHILDKRLSKLDFSILKINTAISDIIVDEQDNIWIGTQGQGVFCYKPSEAEKKQKLYFNQGTLFKTSFVEYAQLYCNDLLALKNGVLVATNNGIVQLVLSQSKIINTSLENFTIPNNTIVTSLAYFNNNLYLGTVNAGMYSYDFIFKKLITQFTIANGILENHITSLFATDNYLFIGTKNKGVSKYIPALANLKEPTLQFQSLTINSGLTSEHINCIDVDAEKNIWIGTIYKLNQYFDEQFEIYGRNQGLPNSIIWSILPDRISNDLWVGTDNGLYKLKRNANTNKSIFEPIAEMKENEVNNITALYQDDKGDLWFSNFGKGIYKYSYTTKKISKFDKISATEIFSITGDNKSIIWIATNKQGIYAYNTNADSIIQYTTDAGLGGNSVYQVYRDSKNNIWAAVIDGNVSVWNGVTWKQFDKKDNYDIKFTLSIFEDSKGKIWLGTYEKGLYTFQENIFKKTSNSNSNAELIYALQEDVNKNLWVGTNVGLEKINISNNVVKHYSKYDGFLGVEINPNAICKTSDENIWMGTIIGLVNYQPNKSRNINFLPVLTLNEPRIFYENIKNPENKTYNYKQDHFTFDFSGSNLTNPRDVIYEYFLEGVDDIWLPKTSVNYVTYQNLAPGSYTFKLRASSDNKKWTAIKTYNFIIKPPFYKTWIFYIIAGLLFLLFIILFIYIRTRALKRVNKMLEDQVQDRTRELKDERDNVSKKNEQINLQNIALERINTNITDSINYAKRIQDTLFVTVNEFEDALRDAFILFRPKDIVSGDFYWMKQVDNKVAFSLADCTGHGVPGAFMSIMGYNLLNEITAEQNLEISPVVIMNELKKRLQNSLSHHHDDDKLADGMDMAMCCIDFDTLKLKYTGAFISLYIIRNGNIIEFKADKYSIGKSFYDLDFKSFNEHSFQLMKGDILYLFSDGYPDQKISKDNNVSKYYLRNFKNLLLQIHNKSTKIQMVLLEDELNKYMENEQTDDITVIGIKIN